MIGLLIVIVLVVAYVYWVGRTAPPSDSPLTDDELDQIDRDAW